jgi:hypothetical protein
MIPIECPRCGKGGNVPPDRLNSKLHCKACDAIFHVDVTGRIELGPPGQPDKNQNQSYSRKGKGVAMRPELDFDLKQTLLDLPIPVKVAVPVVLLGILYFTFFNGPSAPDYKSRAETIAMALASNDRSRILSYGTADSSEATGKWFDLMHGQLEKLNIGSSVSVNSALWSGNPSKDGDILMQVFMSNSGGTASAPPMNLHLKKGPDGVWLLEGNKSLGDAEQILAAASKPSTPTKK